MKTDLNGSDNVVSYIKQSKLTKFRINRPNAHRNAVPVFEHNEKNSTNDKAIDSFMIWANYTDNSNAYELELSNNLEECQENDIDTSTKKGKTIKVTFTINSAMEQLQANTHNSGQVPNIAELIDHALLKYQTRQNDNVLIARLDAMDNKINAALESDEDEDEELSGLNNPNILAMLGTLTKLFAPKQAAVINGENENRIANINRAIRILSKHDSEIDSDLLKLANLAETNINTFNLLLNSLRSM